jgi:hypothetical protein
MTMMRTPLWAITAAALLALGCDGTMDPGGGSELGGGGDMAGSPPPDLAGGNMGCVPECGLGFACQTNTCVAEGSALWVLKVTRGTVKDKNPDGDAWDPFSGLPDPFACMTINGQRLCTMSADNTLSPMWNETLHTASASAILSGVLVEYWDYDPTSANDAICPMGTKMVTMDDLKSGMLTAGCDHGSFTVTMRPQ